MERLTIKDIPELPRYVSVAQTAKIFGISKVSVYDKIYNQRKFDTVFRVGGEPDDPLSTERPFLLLLREEVMSVHQAELDKAANVPLQVRTKEWNRRIKTWGRDEGWMLGVANRGRPTLELVEAYLKAHPEDPRPV